MNTNRALAVSVEDRRSAGRAAGVPLPEALDAPRRALISPQAGKLCYYQDVSHGGRLLVLLHSVNAAPSSFEMKPLWPALRTQSPVAEPRAV
jgi:hypothetical protein